MSSPAPTPGTLIEHRRENKIVLEIKIHPRSTGSELPWDCIHIPRTKSVQRSAVLGGKKALEFRLEVQSATTGTIRDALCERCTEKESQNSLRPPTLVDFTSKTDIIDLKGGNAQVTFRFLCLSTHHGIADSEYRITAIFSNGDQIVAQHPLETCLRVTSRGAKTKNARLTRTGAINLDSARSSEDKIQDPAEAVLWRDTIDNSAPSTSGWGPTASAFNRPPNTSGVLHNARRMSNPIAILPITQHLALDTPAAGGDCVISLLNPSCGATSGGEQIVLVVVNLPPSITLFARFGDNIVSTSYHAPGVLVCNLPPATQPGTIEVTLSQTPSLDAPTYAKSLVKFTYESDTNKAAMLLLRGCNDEFRLEAMSFIQRMFQSHGNRGPATFMPQASSSRTSEGNRLDECAHT